MLKQPLHLKEREEKKVTDVLVDNVMSGKMNKSTHQ